MYQQDWFMRQIEAMGQALGQMISIKAVDIYQKEIIDYHSEADRLEKNLLDLLEHFKINEAENLLFDCLQQDDARYLVVAVNFYMQLNQLSDEQLLSNNFSREEVWSGLHDVKAIFNVQA